jgi:hypothetical protein
MHTGSRNEGSKPTADMMAGMYRIKEKKNEGKRERELKLD